MGRKNRRMRWRTLTIADEQLSDSDESINVTEEITSTETQHDHQRSLRYQNKSYQQNGGKSFYQQQQQNGGGRYMNTSSQSTPIRRYHPSNHHHYQHHNKNDYHRNETASIKSTRSSSTTSENKVTFNEDEYTRITTPRQDVLFKKGYLNKPKTYQTQTSTGTSTTASTTGNGTPDHQSTDLEYESQFVFPNGFVDQNGVYYINSYEPYPLMVYNAAPYYPDFTNVRTKRSSTGSLTDSTSPNNEEVSPDSNQDGGTNGGGYFNVIYPGFYYDGTTINRATTTNPDDTTTPTEQGNCGRTDNNRKLPKKKKRRKPSDADDDDGDDDNKDNNDDEDEDLSSLSSNDDHVINDDAQKLLMNGLSNNDNNNNNNNNNNDNEDEDKKSELKPDAEEFIPLAFRQPLPSTPIFLPLPIDFNGHTYLPHGIPINFIPTQSAVVTTHEEPLENSEEKVDEITKISEENCAISEAKSENLPPNNNHNNNNNNTSIDLETIVSKLEEAAKKQEDSIKEEHANHGEEFKKNDVKSTKVHKKFPKKSNENYSNRKKNWTNAAPSANEDNLKPNNSNKNSHNDNDLNYSATVKKTVKKPLKLQIVSSKVDKMDETIVKLEDRKEVNRKPQQSPQKQQKSSKNQWISVSNRKKRRQRTSEENDDINEEIEGHESDEKDLFEAYDVDLLEDVIVKNKEDEIIKIIDVKKVDLEDKVEKIKKDDEIDDFKTINRKKSKKSNKTHVKRVIIKDIDLSQNFDETTQPPVEEIKKIAVNSVTVETFENKSQVNEDTINEKKSVIPIVGNKQETVNDKKTVLPTVTAKKKKKKSKVHSATNSQTSSTLTLNTIDDNSYDFLLETIDNKTNEKTNIEISQELDKIIQKGIYNNLEGKLKQQQYTNGQERDSENDDFFKTVLNNISKTTLTTTKTIKSPDFSKLLKPSIFNHSNNDDNTTTKKTGDFLGVTTLTSPHGGGSNNDTNLQQLKYPVTEAVKEWITRTRESTPELELLKSPQMIFEEFAEQFIGNNLNDQDPDDDQKNAITSPLAPSCKQHNHTNSKRGDGDDEITIFSRHNNDRDDDIQQNWNDFDQKSDNIKTIDDITVDDDVGDIAIYESKYGKNEDYLKIKAEVDEKTQQNDRYNGNLPYRAICCSIM